MNNETTTNADKTLTNLRVAGDCISIQSRSRMRILVQHSHFVSTIFSQTKTSEISWSSEEMCAQSTLLESMERNRGPEKN